MVRSGGIAECVLEAEMTRFTVRLDLVYAKEKLRMTPKLTGATERVKLSLKRAGLWEKIIRNSIWIMFTKGKSDQILVLRWERKNGFWPW